MNKLKPIVPNASNNKADYLPSADGGNSVYQPPISTLNRANELASSPNQDEVDNLSIGLKDIDEAVEYYFTNKIKPSIQQNGHRVNVPIMYGSPAMWSSLQKDGMYRDKNGKLLSPVIIYKRNGFDKNRIMGNKLDGNVIHNFHLFKTKYNRKNQYTPYGKIFNTSPSEEYKLVAVPDYVTVTYSCVLITDYVEQNNKIVEDINFVSDAYWGQPNKFQFKANIENYQQVVEVTSGEDRVAKTTFTLTLNGYFINNNLIREMAGAKRVYSKSTISFGLEVGLNGKEDINMRAGSIPKTIKPGKPEPQQDSTAINAAIVTYVGTNKQVSGQYTTSATATFPNQSILAAPTGLPPTSLDNFTFFVNGIYVPKSGIVSFAQVGNNCVLTINPVLLDYAFKDTFEFTAIGKFS